MNKYHKRFQGYLDGLRVFYWPRFDMILLEGYDDQPGCYAHRFDVGVEYFTSGIPRRELQLIGEL